MRPPLAAYRMLLRSISAGVLSCFYWTFLASQYNQATGLSKRAAFKGDGFMLQQSKREVRQKYQVRPPICLQSDHLAVAKIICLMHIIHFFGDILTACNLCNPIGATHSLDLYDRTNCI